MASALRTTASVPFVASPNSVLKLAQRVAHDQRSGQEGDTEEHRQDVLASGVCGRAGRTRSGARRRSRPPACWASNAFIRSRTLSARRDSIRSTRRPSARKTTSSACAAATWSRATMTTVRSTSGAPRGRRGGSGPPAGAGVEVAGGVRRRRRRRDGRRTPGPRRRVCCCPPESSAAVVEPVAQADDVDERVDPLAGALRPGEVQGSVMFSATVSVGIRSNAWKTKPIRSRRSRVRRRSSSVLLAGCRR